MRHHVKPVRAALAARLLAAGVLALGAPIARADPPAPPSALRAGFCSLMFVGVNESDARASLKIWAQTMGRENDVPVDTELQIFSGPKDTREALESGKVDIVSTSTIEYWSIRKGLPIADTVVSGTVHGNVGEEYLLLVGSENPARSLGELKGESLAVSGGPSENLSAIWLETVLLERNLGASDTFWGQLTFAGKLSRAVLPVFFGKVDACVVSSEGYRTMCELNPQIGRRTRILERSPLFIPFSCLFRNNPMPPFSRKLLAEIGNIAATPSGAQALSLFHIEQMQRLPLAALDPTCALLDRHEKLLADLRSRTLAQTAPAQGARE